MRALRRIFFRFFRSYEGERTLWKGWQDRACQWRRLSGPSGAIGGGGRGCGIRATRETRMTPPFGGRSPASRFANGFQGPNGVRIRPGCGPEAVPGFPVDRGDKRRPGWLPFQDDIRERRRSLTIRMTDTCGQKITHTRRRRCALAPRAGGARAGRHFVDFRSAKVTFLSRSERRQIALVLPADAIAG